MLDLAQKKFDARAALYPLSMLYFTIYIWYLTIFRILNICKINMQLIWNYITSKDKIDYSVKQ